MAMHHTSQLHTVMGMPAQQAMHYRDQKIQEILESIGNPVYDDLFSGSNILKLCEDLKLTIDDTTVSFSFHGAQLQQNKKSDTWIAIWIVDDYSPDTQYKKKQVLPAVIIPGPDKAKHSDSFCFGPFTMSQQFNKRMMAWDFMLGMRSKER